MKTAVRDNEKAFLTSVLQRIINDLCAHCGSLFLLDQDHNELVLGAYHNSKGFVLTDIKKRVGEGIAGSVVKLCRPVLVEDIDSDPRFSRNGFSHYISKSFISIPLLYGEQLIGLVNVTDKASGEPFTRSDLEFADNELRVLLKPWLEGRVVVKEDPRPEEDLPASSHGNFLNMTGQHPKMQRIYSLIEAVASTRATVLICGESGTGKRLIAHAIHQCNSVERRKPFVEVSCGALTETLLESELFGHVKGAYTGALKDRIGRFELADKGTIFLDEIDSCSPAMQVKLLRVLQDGEFERVGENKTIKVDIRIIAATNQDLAALIAEGKFRRDLFYRLNIINIEVPPLRERVSDISLLVQDLIKKHAQELGREIRAASNDVLEQFRKYPWPGNIRELENVVERAVILAKGPQVSLQDLPDHLSPDGWPDRIEKAMSSNSAGGSQVGRNGGGNGGNGQAHKGLKLRSAIKDSEQELIARTLEAAHGCRNKAAEDLGIDRTTLYKKMANYGLLKVRRRNGEKVLQSA